jgi:hypothetical protein
MNDNIEEKTYLCLWKYFQDKATSVKGAMFTTVTWVLGFAAALSAFMFSNLAEYSSDALLTIEKFALLISFAGLSLCVYAYYAISESAKHIRNNWTYADRCMTKVNGLKDIVNPNENNEKDWENRYLKGVPICKRLAIIVYLFALVFVCIPILVFCL